MIANAMSAIQQSALLVLSSSRQHHQRFNLAVLIWNTCSLKPHLFVACRPLSFASSGLKIDKSRCCTCPPQPRGDAASDCKSRLRPLLQESEARTATATASQSKCNSQRNTYSGPAFTSLAQRVRARTIWFDLHG